MVLTNAFAVHDTGRFQLDGDASSATQPINPAATDDWDKVCHQVTITEDPTSAAHPNGLIPDQCAGAGDTTGATAVSWTAEANQNSSIFTGGGSKDPIDIDQWAWKDGAGGLPDKDNLQHSFAARYSLPADPVDSDPPGAGNLGNGTSCPSTTATCELLVFGSDRFDNSGDAQQGFWFFQNRITLGTAKLGGGTAFVGVHKNGDILVISDFSNGGATSTITVYAWDDTVSGNLRQLETSDNAKCDPVLAGGDAFCGIVNPTNGTFAPWSFTDKSGLHTYLNGEFYEGGINLSALPGNIANECFASVASETRSSTSTTATLKDFVLGNFGSCTPDITTTPSATLAATVAPGTAVTDLAVFSGTGPGSPPNPTSPPNVVFSICGPISPSNTTLQCDGSDSAHTAATFGATKPWVHCTGAGAPAAFCTGADAQGVSEALSDSVSKTAVGIYCFKAAWAGDSNYLDGATEIGTTAGSECFRVKDTSTTVTDQTWLPNDSATVKLSDGTTNGSGTVTFTLYDNGTCTPGTNDANVLHVFSSISLVNGTASTNNTTYGIAAEPGRTISWKVTFTPSDTSAVQGSTSNCESSVVTIDDND